MNMHRREQCSALTAVRRVSTVKTFIPIMECECCAGMLRYQILQSLFWGRIYFGCYCDCKYLS